MAEEKPNIKIGKATPIIGGRPIGHAIHPRYGPVFIMKTGKQMSEFALPKPGTKISQGQVSGNVQSTMNRYFTKDPWYPKFKGSGIQPLPPAPPAPPKIGLHPSKFKNPPLRPMTGMGGMLKLGLMLGLPNMQPPPIKSLGEEKGLPPEYWDEG